MKKKTEITPEEYKSILDAFTEALPENVSAGKLADGMDIKFMYEGKSYTINTRDEQARTRPLEDFYKKLAKRAVEAVINNI